MSENKLDHTPGPWVKDYGGTTHHIKAVNDRRGTPTVCKYNDNFNHGGKLIVADSLSESEKTANGLLIACAPEMIDALIETEKKNYKTWQMVGNPNIPKYTYLNKEIIEKATGKKIEEVMK